MSQADETIFFRCTINSFPYIAFGDADTVSMLSWYEGSAKDVLAAIQLIEKEALKMGFRKMSTYVDEYDHSSMCITDFIRRKSSRIIWEDKRFKRYEWDI